MSRMQDRSNIMGREEAGRSLGVDLAARPFCGSRHVGVYMTRSPHVTCMRCDADGPVSFNGDPRAAALLWNHRPVAPAPESEWHG